ncbi:hypothetical protein V6N13_073156 [Hibiscus sabdariffa]|uniref:NAC domain-containing protein n=1 Tax=Hibiscus sabdariffa TaxID=183260 RepID=A0ABR2EA47_9ROSI
MHVSFLPIKPFPSLALFGVNLKSSKQQQRELQKENNIPSAFLFLKRSLNKLVKNNTGRRIKDDELVNHYLSRKCASQSIVVPIIVEIDLYKFDPWQLPEMAQVSILKALIVAFFMAFLTAASAQVSEAPSPAPDAGAGFSVGVSAAAVGFSFILSLLAFLKH